MNKKIFTFFQVHMPHSPMEQFWLLHRDHVRWADTAVFTTDGRGERFSDLVFERKDIIVAELVNRGCQCAEACLEKHYTQHPTNEGLWAMRPERLRFDNHVADVDILLHYARRGVGFSRVKRFGEAKRATMALHGEEFFHAGIRMCVAPHKQLAIKWVTGREYPPFAVALSKRLWRSTSMWCAWLEYSGLTAPADLHRYMRFDGEAIEYVVVVAVAVDEEERRVRAFFG